MKKHNAPNAVTATPDKLGLKSETLRKMSETLTDEQLKEVVGGQRAISHISGGC
jgi:bacteriocin-like protein